MRARFVNELDSSNTLKIFKNNDGFYSVIKNSFLYTFLWKPFIIYNFKKIGKISSNYVVTGRLINNPNIQMILQLQRNLKQYS